MYFGKIDTKMTSGESSYSNLNKEISSDRIDAGNFQIITKTEHPGKGAASSNQQWLSYNYEQGRLLPISYGLALLRTDILNAKPSSGNSLASAGGSDNRPGFRINKLYKKQDGSGLRAYSNVVDKYNSNLVLGQLRVTLTPIGDTGRIKSEIRFLNNEKSPHYYTFMNGIHSDLAGNHTATKTYSLGNLKGIYAGIDGVSTGQVTPDKLPYRVYFHKDGYPNEPSEMRPKDELNGNWFSIGHYWNNYDPLAKGISLDDDPGRGLEFKANHPVYSFKWDPRLVQPGERMDIRQDISVTEEGENTPPVISLDQEDQECIKGDLHISGKWHDADSDFVDLYYQIDDGTPKKFAENVENKIPGTEYAWDTTIPSAEIPNGNHNIKVYAIDSKGSTSNIAEVNLKCSKSIVTAKYVDEQGNELSQPIEKSGEIGETYKFEPITIPGYKLKTIEGNPEGTFTKDPQTVVFIYEKGNLEFISAPTSVSFGTNLQVSSADKTYIVKSKEGNLTVQDNRVAGQAWSMTAKLLEDMTSESDQNHKLLDSLHYYHKGQDYTFKKDTSLPVYEMVSTGNEPVNISDFWESKLEGLVLKVRAGQAYTESYKGTIQWTLQDVPGNN
ncbi:hypothetical protein COE58_24450 [Bacillus cereus]|nr:hypothetical protein COE58_24450 [Bacillus cereus]